MKALHAVRVCKWLVTMALMSPLAGGDLQAQVGLSSGVTQVSLIGRASSHASIPAVSSHRQIGRRGDLREAAVRITLLANGRYRLVARGNPGSTSRVWVQGKDGGYHELVPGSVLTISQEPGGSSEREVRYMTDAMTAAAFTQVPVRFELVVDPAI